MESTTGYETSDVRPRFRTWQAAVAFALPILLLAPFANKAYNFDDPAFLWVAQQIRQEPMDFFGSVVDQGYKETPMYAFNHNPPGVSYYLAFLSLFFGWDEIPLHLGMDLIAGMGGLGIYLLAGRLCRRPLLVTVLAIATPVFLVSASNLMTDVPMVTFYVWAVYAWVVGLDEDRQGWLALGAVAIAVSALCKYFGITAVPLLFVYGLLKRRRLGLWSLHLLIPLAALAAFQWWTWRLYGSANLSDAVGVALSERFRAEEGALFRPIAVLVFLGGAFAPLALYAPWLYRWRALVGGAAAVAVLMLPLVEGYSLVQLMMGVAEPFNLGTALHVGLMLAAGVFVVSLAIPELARRRDAESALLVLWIAGTLTFAVAINHFVNARVLLPILPAAVILIGRHARWPETARARASWQRPEWWPLVPAALFSLWILGGDYLAGDHARDAVRRAVRLAEQEDVRLHFSGFGAIHYYAERAGAIPFDAELGEFGTAPKPKMQREELLLADSVGTERWQPPPARMREAAMYRYDNPLGVTTYHPLLETGFYNHMGGFLPYVAGQIPPERFGVYRWTGPSYTAEEDSEP